MTDNLNLFDDKPQPPPKPSATAHLRPSGRRKWRKYTPAKPYDEGTVKGTERRLPVDGPDNHPPDLDF